MNIWTFTGSLGSDCKVSTTQSGMTVCEFSVAVNSGYGEKKKTTWASCTIFGKKAEGQLPGYLLKGQKVCVSGEMTLDEWEKDGIKHSRVKVFVDKLDLNGDRPQQPQQQYQQPQQAPQQAPQQQYAPQSNRQNGNGTQGSYAAPQQQQAPSGMDDFDQDIPFS